MSSVDAPGDIGGEITASGAAMMALTTVAIVLRFVARGTSKHARYWWDDWLALIAWVFAVTLYSVYFNMRNLGYGRHIGTIPPENISKILLDFYVNNIIYNVGLSLVKLSALMFYVRVFSMKRLWFRIAVYTVGAMAIMWCIGITFAACFECSPVKKTWQPEIPGTCVPEYGLYLGTALPNIFIDFFILIMPFPFLKSLQIDWKHKLGLVLVFMLGYCSMALSIARTAEVTRFTPNQVTDPTWYLTIDIVLVQVELGCGLISICLPAHAALVRYTAKHVLKLPFLASGDSMSIRGKDGMHAGAMGEPWDRDSKKNRERGLDYASVDSGYRSQAWVGGGSGDDVPLEDVPRESIGVRKEVNVRNVSGGEGGSAGDV